MRYHIGASENARIQRYFQEDDDYYETRNEPWEDPNSFVTFVHLREWASCTRTLC